MSAILPADMWWFVCYWFAAFLSLLCLPLLLQVPAGLSALWRSLKTPATSVDMVTPFMGRWRRAFWPLLHGCTFTELPAVPSSFLPAFFLLPSSLRAFNRGNADRMNAVWWRRIRHGAKHIAHCALRAVVCCRLVFSALPFVLRTRDSVDSSRLPV